MGDSWLNTCLRWISNCRCPGWHGEHVLWYTMLPCCMPVVFWCTSLHWSQDVQLLLTHPFVGLIFLFRDQISWDKFKPSPLSNWFNDELVAVIKLLDMMICYNQSRRSVLQLPLARLGMDSAIIMAGTSYLELQIISIYIHMAVYNMLFRFQNKCCSFSIRTKTTTLIFNG